MLRFETRARARALQVLYAWDLQGRPLLAPVVHSLPGQRPRTVAVHERAEALAEGVVRDLHLLDPEIESAAEGWRFERIGVVERNVLRLALHELLAAVTPARVVIDEAMRLTHWFAGSKAPPFVNGVLDALARRHGRL